MQCLLAGLVGGVDAARCPDALVQEIVPDVHDHAGYRRYTRPVFFKSHHLPRPGYRRVVYLLRDGRDAMVSYFHHYNALFPAVDFATLVRTAPGLPSRWHEHVEAWLANPHQADLLVVKYEDLHGDPAAMLKKIAGFAGVQAADSDLARAVEAASFPNQQKREKTLGWEDPRWPKGRLFVRRGEIGSHRDEMPPEALGLFLAEAEPTLRKTGYLA
ncbi:MAG TPA: sulfotransferase domain-containing protein [Candidatus Acidoferrales bacterium]|nr:sulfotransferase domain-containing protein [Candidatus Acidoferrales bacterium]